MAENARKREKQERKRIERENAEIVRRFEREKRQKPTTSAELSMRDDSNIVEFHDLCTYFYTDIGVVKAVDGVSFDIPKGKTVGVVGESGCGKSVTSLSLMRLVQGPSGQIVGGEIRYNTGRGGVNIVKLPIDQMQKLRGNEISMIFQEPMTSLNPVFTVGVQLDEAIQLHNSVLPKAAIKARSIEMLNMVGISRPEGIYESYPHELSGGMRQRAMIAMALSCNPKLIIADEPTTALDVTIQAQILDLLRGIKDKISASIMLITHDLGVVAEMADYVVVMYAGRIVEKGTAGDIYLNPKHPYTIGLLNSKPVLNKEIGRLYSIPGQVPNPINMPSCCYFKSRCDKCVPECDGVYPPVTELSETHTVSCYAVQKEGK